MKEIGVYVHIPFCKSKCYYCDFISYANKESCIKEYIDNVKREIRESQEYKARTIYIGGGTPSYIDTQYIKEILNELCYDDAEITIEVNPGTINEKKLTDYFNMGINRLSIGLQSANNELLRQIGRIHKYEDFLSAYKIARKVGFKNINVDLMLGLPNQTIEILQGTLGNVLKLEPEHISIYSLILEEKTKLEELVNNGVLRLPDDELERKLYWSVKHKLEEAGYIHYEISNFAKLGYFSKHNLDCWEQNEYIGYGLGAHSYINNTRYCNSSDMDKYMKLERQINEQQNEYTKMQEYILLGLRKIQGIDKNEFYNRFGKGIYEVFKSELDKLIKLNLVEDEGEYIKLSSKGIDLANQVWQEFV